MVECVNGGDKEALRELMRRCTRPMYDRALEITGDVYAAKDAVRRALREMAEAARYGECPENVEEWALMLAQRCCDEELYYKHLIDSMLADLPLTARETRAACGAAPRTQGAEQGEEQPYGSAENALEPEHANTLPPPVRRAMPSAWEKDDSSAADDTVTLAMPAQRDRRMEAEEPFREERGDIFAPPKRKAARALPPEVYKDEEDEEIYPAPRKRGAAAAKAELPVLFDADDLDDEDDEPDERSGGGGLALLIILLTLIAAGLLWVIAVKLMRLGYLDISDFGFADWFNEHLFKFY
ncbi:MAG: hypothetical protein ABFC62_08945 [Clostridiaceae bacterium]|nr:hypothetical protein [Eubacteriales bacterium]